MQPIWLTCARELQAIAQSGLAFANDPFDRERYESIRLLAARMFAEHSEAELGRIEALFSQQAGYATPKVDVRGAVFRDDGSILLVREIADADRWTLPGGWADVNETPSECVAREVREESGFEVSVRKLAALYDRDRHGHVPPTRSTSTSCSLSVTSTGEHHVQGWKLARSGFSRSTSCRMTSLPGASAAISSSACSSIGARRTYRPNLIRRCPKQPTSIENTRDESRGFNVLSSPCEELVTNMRLLVTPGLPRNTVSGLWNDIWD